jgi:hypothetical protein
MKKIFLSTMLLAALSLGFTSCLKDKGFDNHEYGINDPDSSPKGVGFPEAYSAEATINSINPSTSSQTIDAVAVLLLGAPAGQDIHVNLVANQSLVTDYNTNNGTNFITFPAGSYSIPSMKVTIPAGSRIGYLKVTVPSTAPLTFSDIYGLGFSIASVDEAGYNIAANLKNIVIGVNVKNQYDADYRTTGFLFHPSSPRALDDTKRIYTLSATGCRAGLGDLYPQNYYFAFEVSGTNTLTNWVAQGACPAAPASGFFTADVPNPAGLNPYPATGSDKPGVAPWLHSTYNNTYVPATKTFWMHYGYGVGATSQDGWSRQAYEKWVRKA